MLLQCLDSPQILTPICVLQESTVNLIFNNKTLTLTLTRIPIFTRKARFGQLSSKWHTRTLAGFAILILSAPFLLSKMLLREEDDRILDSDTTGQMPSCSQQWYHNIAVKVAEFTGTFEKQALAFNVITRKRAMGEFLSEERLMIGQSLLQEEKRKLFDLKTEIDAREKAGREAQLRMAAQQEMMARAPVRASVLGPQGNNNVGDHDHNVNSDEVMNGWGNTRPKDEKEPSEYFLNDEEMENGDSGAQGEWREVGEFDLNSR